MGFKVALKIRQVNGQLFEIDVDADADCLGVKVLIFESQGIPINEQRLVFNGSQIEDDVKLSSIGVTDSSTIFLVRSVANGPAVQVNAAAAAAVAPAPVAEPVQRVVIVNQGYAPLDIESGEDEGLSQKKMDQVYHLAKWLRAYYVFCLVVSSIALFALCVGLQIWGILAAIIAITIFAFAVKGTRKLNVCCLIPAIVGKGVMAFLALVGAIFAFAYGCALGGLFVLVIAGMKIAIFSSAIKLCMLMNRLSPNEKQALCTRIQTQTSCCCCTKRQCAQRV